MSDVTAVRLAEVLARVRAQAPLVHSMTNAVVTTFTANVLLAIGASPIMTQAQDELEEIAAIAAALNVNIGTLEPASASAMRRAAGLMTARGKPFVLDPVGAGATSYRTRTALDLVALGPRILRGNPGEIGAIAAARAGRAPASAMRGVDSLTGPDAVAGAAAALAADEGLTVAMTGATDIVTDGSRQARVSGGSATMTRITGTGCALTAAVGACAAVEDDPFIAALAAVALFKGAAGAASRTARGPGSLAIHFLDCLALTDGFPFEGVEITVS